MRCLTDKCDRKATIGPYCCNQCRRYQDHTHHTLGCDMRLEDEAMGVTLL